MFPNKLDSPEQERLLGQLKELFVTCPTLEIRQTCIRYNWNLDLCVNHLMNSTSAVEKEQSTNTSQTTKNNKPSREDAMVKKEAVIVKDATVDEERIGGIIKNGYRVMILMRGPPGVGKSFAAKLLVTKYVDLQPPHNRVNDFVFSSDDYFQNSYGAYKYNVKLLSEAHEFNQKRVRENASAGLSPIIVDNTNMQLWEMMPYVQAAVQNGYIIEIVEPKTTWHNCVYKLSQRNKHGVPANKIRRMIEKYEKAEPADLLKMLKNTKYSVSIPMLRSLPPISLSNKEIENDANGKRDSVSLAIQDNGDISGWGTYEENVPKEQRRNIKSKVSREVQKEISDNGNKAENCPSSQPVKSASARDVYSLLEKKLTNVWKPYEVESVDFWDKTQPPQSFGQQIATPVSVSVGSKTNAVNTPESNSLLNLLRSETGKDEHKETDFIKKKIFDCHSVGCPYENSAFATLRQMYPNKQPSGLWDLFQKCNGDIDWAVDILLKEDELTRLRNDDEIKFDNYDTTELVCSCDCQQGNTGQGTNLNFLPLQAETLKNVGFIANSRENKQPMTRAQRTRFIRHNTMYDPELREIDESLKKQFVLSDDHYSQHLLKLRNRRRGTPPIIAPQSASIQSSHNEANDDDDDDDEEESEANEEVEMLEMSLGEQLVEQLLNNFQNETSLEVRIPPSLPLDLKVFMPRSLAKQLYLLWMESAYNHLEEERQKIVREDEEFARLLKHPQYAEYKQSPNNLREMLDIEYAWTLYMREKEDLDMRRNQEAKQSQPKDMASHLTQIKLCENFPDIPPDTLLDIFATTDNSYNETMSILRSTMKADSTDAAKTQDDSDSKKNQTDDRSRIDFSSNAWDYNEENQKQRKQSPEEAKRQALREFEEARNLAAHHCQLRAECYQKAKESIQAGNGGAGLYYSQIANLHKQKIDTYNHRAANCIMNVHKYTQNNPDHLDLHYLHMLEALECLDLFLDRHITALRLASRNYKYIFIITGRGKHSAGGVSVIKSKVKSRLEERSLKWNEVNPGLLKVKIFSSSRHSQSFL